METYVDIFLNANGEKASVIYNKIVGLGLKPTLGDHDFVFKWKGIVAFDEEMKFIDKIQSTLTGSGALLRFTTMR